MPSIPVLMFILVSFPSKNKRRSKYGDIPVTLCHTSNALSYQ